MYEKGNIYTLRSRFNSIREYIYKKKNPEKTGRYIVEKFKKKIKENFEDSDLF